MSGSPLVAKKRRLFGGKKGFKSSFNWLKLFCRDIFDQLVGLFLSPSWAIDSEPIRARGIILKYCLAQFANIFGVIILITKVLLNGTEITFTKQNLILSRGFMQFLPRYLPLYPLPCVFGHVIFTLCYPRGRPFEFCGDIIWVISQKFQGKKKFCEGKISYTEENIPHGI